MTIKYKVEDVKAACFYHAFAAEALRRGRKPGSYAYILFHERYKLLADFDDHRGRFDNGQAIIRAGAVLIVSPKFGPGQEEEANTWIELLEETAISDVARVDIDKETAARGPIPTGRFYFAALV